MREPASRYLELPSCYFEGLSCYFEGLSCYLEALSCHLERMWEISRISSEIPRPFAQSGWQGWN